MVWIKANERLPENKDPRQVTFRNIKTKKSLVVYSYWTDTQLELDDAEYKSAIVGTLVNKCEVEWLDESCPHLSPSAPVVAEPYPVKVYSYGGSTGVNDYLMSDGSIKAINQDEANETMASLHSPAERIEESDAVQEWRDECERLAGIVEFWQKKCHELNPGFQIPKIDNL